MELLPLRTGMLAHGSSRIGLLEAAGKSKKKFREKEPLLECKRRGSFREMPTWDANQYLRFAEERTRPCRDLLARIPLTQPRRVIDLGCGPGNSTAVLAARWPQAEIAGLDSSPAMVARASGDFPQFEWIEGDVSAWQSDEPFDVVFSNAALQWVPGIANCCRACTGRWRRVACWPCRCRAIRKRRPTGS